MKHWNKVLVAAAVICGVAGIATSARLLVTAVHRYSTQKPLVRGAEDYSWPEDEPEEEEITEPEETDGTAEGIQAAIGRIEAHYDVYSRNAYENSKAYDYRTLNRKVYDLLCGYWGC